MKRLLKLFRSLHYIARTNCILELCCFIPSPPAPLPEGEGSILLFTCFSQRSSFSKIPLPLSRRERGAYYPLLVSLNEVLFRKLPCPHPAQQEFLRERVRGNSRSLMTFLIITYTSIYQFQISYILFILDKIIQHIEK